MKICFKVLTLIIVAFMFVINAQAQKEGPVKVEIRKVNGVYKFYRNGEPYFVKGAGLEIGDMELLAKHGANSLRNWAVDNGREPGEVVLDRAHKYGLSVIMGIDVNRERLGFDYNNADTVAKQLEWVRRDVMRIKDHPALLAYGIGNELNMGTTNMKVWDAVNDIAKMIHEIDPNHPVTTMLSGISKENVETLRQRCPDLDFVSVQMYGDLINLQKRINDSGWDGPYVVSEWGATGHWEVAKTTWGAPIEQTSSEKAKSFMERYEKAIKADSVRCIGNYVFVWQQKQERTPTWYGLFSETNEETEAIDVMHYLWNGKWPENRCPQVSSPLLNGKTAYESVYVKPGEQLTGSIIVNEFDKSDKLTYKWEILSESTEKKIGGDVESRPETLLNTTTDINTITVPAPHNEGAYRFFIYVFDGHNHAGTANIPFYVKK
jgi:hypothetical protein